MSEEKEIELEPPFSMIICASSGSGKTTLLRHLLNHTLKEKFDNIFVMADTADVSEDYDQFKKQDEYKNRIFSSYDEEVINEIYDQQGFLKKKYGAARTPHTLLILDDLMDKVQGNHNLVQKLFWKGRHLKLSVIVLLQKLRGTSTLMRINTKYVIFFRCGNTAELDHLLDEYCGKKERKVIEGELMEHFKQPWSWLLCDLKNQDFSQRYQKGVDKKVIGTIKWYD